MRKWSRMLLMFSLTCVCALPLAAQNQEKKQDSQKQANAKKEKGKQAKGANKKVARKKAAQPSAGSGLVRGVQEPLWIWSSKTAEENQTVLFRREFKIEAGVGTAKFFGTADDQMTVYLDGKEILSSTEWQTPSFKDITQNLTGAGGDGRGMHVLAIKAKNAKSAAALTAKILIESGWADPVAVVTDRNWKFTTGAEPAGWNNLGFNDSAWKNAEELGKLGDKPWTTITQNTLYAAGKMRDPAATPIDLIRVAKGFKVELLHTTSKAEEGSWVNMCVDTKGRLIASDQYGGLFRITVPPLGQAGPVKVEKINVPLGEAQGLLVFNNALYVVVNKGKDYESGLYRVTDTNGDDQYDKVEMLRQLTGGGEHGPHAVIPAPDGKSLYVICGNQTKLTELATSRVPQVWSEDHLLPRMPDGNGFMKDVLGPGGAIYKVDFDGKSWELISTGYRNPFDIAFNKEGDLFTYDADMEWDVNTPWYRPTRVCLSASGVDFGWRNGAGKWPAYYPDSLPAIVNIGPGSPTGICFGYGANFPTKYQDALFISDWSYGKLYAVHMVPSGSTYRADIEEFVTGTPLPLTDVVINPTDKAMYFAIGGRKTTSGLYRVTYTGPAMTDQSPVRSEADTKLRNLRLALEATTVGRKKMGTTSTAEPLPSDVAAVKLAWPNLNHSDRYIRHAARVALEHVPTALWAENVMTERDPERVIQGVIAWARVSQQDMFHRKDKSNPNRFEDLAGKLASKLLSLNFASLPVEKKVDYLRAHNLIFTRLHPKHKFTKQLTEQLEAHLSPNNPVELNAELVPMLVYLQSAKIAAAGVAMMESAPTQEEQIDYARALRMLDAGWTKELRQRYFAWFPRAANYRGGNSFVKFIDNIKKDAVEKLTSEQLAELKPILEAKPEPRAVAVMVKRDHVKDWKLDELVGKLSSGIGTNRNFDRGRLLFSQAQCFACHRYAQEGGSMGPDLTGVAGRFSPRDLLESIIEPSKTISDQYEAVNITTTDGTTVSGRIVNLSGDSLMVMTNMLEPNSMARIDRKLVEQMKPSKTSMMPTGLLNTLKEDEIHDLLAYLLSRGDRNHPAFRKSTGATASADSK